MFYSISLFLNFNFKTTLPKQQTTYFCQMYKLPADFEAVKRHLIRVRFLEEFLSSIKIDPPDIVSVYFSMTLDIKKDRPSLFIIGFSTNAM